MSGPLVLAVPSKGRLKDQAEAWLTDCGLPLRAGGGPRGYTASIDGFEGVQVRLASAADIAAALVSGDVHLGVTGEDLLGELASPESARVMLLRALGFGRADLVVAAPRSWIDVESMADLDDVAHLHLARTGSRLRVATKYRVQARAFFARQGLAECRMVESGGATEGAPAAGAAEVVVDITTSGATLAANGLKVLSDGVILRSQARLAASLGAGWDADTLGACQRLLGIIEARARGRSIASLTWPGEREGAARLALRGLATFGEGGGSDGVIVENSNLFAAAQALAEAAVGPVSVIHPAFLFEPVSDAGARLAAALDL